MNWGWSYDGVNSTVPRNAGPECAKFSTIRKKLIESVVVVTICILAIKWAIKKLRPLPKYTKNIVQEYDPIKQILLTAITFTFGLELGFKFASRSVIYVLNPCHITTIFQIYLLSARPSKTVTVLFRIQMNYLNGPLLAFLFPETDSRTIPMEAAAYWVQHGLLFVVPIYLLKTGGVYNMEKLTDFSWNIISYGLLLIYHFIVLNSFSVPAQVNLNHMLCPAIKDPFDGPYYRIAACVHQAILCPLLCKLFCLMFVKDQQSLRTTTKIMNTNNENNLSLNLEKQNNSSIKNGSGNNWNSSSSSSSSLLPTGTGTKILSLERKQQKHDKRNDDLFIKLNNGKENSTKKVD